MLKAYPIISIWSQKFIYKMLYIHYLDFHVFEEKEL